MSTKKPSQHDRALRLLEASDALLGKLERTLSSLACEKSDSQALRQITSCLKDIKDIQSLESAQDAVLEVHMEDAARQLAE